MNEPIAVLLADDHALVRRGFRRLLEDAPTIRVVGEASDGTQVVEMAAALKPDVVVMDCAMPGMNGLAATRAILSAAPHVRVLMLSMHSEETLVRQAFEAGASGYVLKSARELDLVAAVTKVAAGDKVVDPSIDLSPTPRGERAAALSPRELEVLQLICEGLSNREVAVTLGLSANTVGVHRANIMNALGVHKAAELVVYAIQRGLVTLP